MSRTKTSERWARTWATPLPAAPQPTRCLRFVTCCGPCNQAGALCPFGTRARQPHLPGSALLHRHGVYLQGKIYRPSPLASQDPAQGLGPRGLQGFGFADYQWVPQLTKLHRASYIHNAPLCGQRSDPSWVWWHIPVILALNSQRQEDCLKFQTSLWEHTENLFQNQNKPRAWAPAIKRIF